MTKYGTYRILTATEAAGYVKNGDTIAFSGFTAAGAAKAVPAALAERALEEKEAGRQFRIKVLSGASTNKYIDQDLVDAGAVAWRAPYQSSKSLRDKINSQETEYVDMHLSYLPQAVKNGFFGKINLAVVEATEITPDGRVYLSTSIGASPTFLDRAEKVIIEINSAQSPRLREVADIRIMPSPPRRDPIYIYDPLTRVGWPYCVVDPDKVLGIVNTAETDSIAAFTLPDDICRKIAGHVVEFFLNEMRSGRIPEGFLPLQAGVGNIANAVILAMGEHPDIPRFQMYSEVFQDAMVNLMEDGKLLGASATSLTVTPAMLKKITDNMDFFASRIVLRPQELSNHPGVIRRLCVIGMNTAIEMDIYGNINSSHIYGSNIMNGIGGSGDFTRNAYFSVYMTPSIAKGGKISSVVPMCPHIDNNEHSVQVVVTEQGLADLRGLGPMQRAKRIIDKCAHPLYRPYLEKYIAESKPGHIRHDLSKCFELHRNLIEYGTMLPEAG
ncbi:MAG: succinate CoA transferase [Desulfobacterales bacterium]|nr:succinate CoA transferase [Desulfobacterales bacterium]